MKITVIGAGYVGIVTGTCLAEFGHDVVCVDKDAARIAMLCQGQVPIYEPGLADLLAKNVSGGRLRFTTGLSESVPRARAVFIAVGTPSARRGDGYADLSYIYAAVREMAPHLAGYTVVVNKSTVPIGTARQVSRIISEINPAADFDVASNPEFLREGAALGDFMRPDRVVIGVENEKAAAVLREIYNPLYLIETPIVVTGIETAELIKYAANSFLAVKISFINEMAHICEKVGADAIALAKAIGLDGRIGKEISSSRPRLRGILFPKDTLAFLRTVQEFGVNARIVEAAVEVNAFQKARMVKKIRDAVGGCEAGKTIGVLGLTFKPETDDMRDAPALTILPALIEKGARIIAHDPQGMLEAAKYLPGGITYVDNPYKVFPGADAVVLLTEWNQYRGLDFNEVMHEMKNPVLVDLRNVYDPQRMKETGFTYFGNGRN